MILWHFDTQCKKAITLLFFFFSFFWNRSFPDNKAVYFRGKNLDNLKQFGSIFVNLWFCSWNRYLMFLLYIVLHFGFPWWLSGKKKSACQWRRSGSMPGSGRSPGEGHAHSSILALEIPWTGDPGGLQSMGLQKSRTCLRDWTTNSCILVLQLKGLISLVEISHIYVWKTSICR